MTPDEQDLRRALEARSGEPSPQFRPRLTAALDEGRPTSNLMQAVAMVAVIALTLGTVGALLLSRNARSASHEGPANATRVVSPTPGPTFVPEAPVFGPATAQISAPSRDAVWVLVASTLLFRSTNRGDTWEARSVPPITPGGFQEISFIDAQQGWYLTGPMIETQCKGAATQIWHTNDGAATWQQVTVEMWTVSYTSDNAAADPQCRQGLSFVDPLHGFIAAWATGRHPTIYRTLDGGKNWAGADLPDPPDFRTGIGSSLRAGLVNRFGSALYVEVGSGQDSQYVFRSTDGGSTWSWMRKIPSPYVVMVTESRWLQLVVPGQSMESTNSGQQWHPFASDFNTDTPVGGPQIVFADSQVGYAEGRGQLQRTVDGGLHWIRIKTPGVYQP